jgi:hypothetical protein
MKFKETLFDEYIQKVKSYNIHKELNKHFEFLSKEPNHLVLYGRNGVGKYSQALWYLSKLSPSKLKYERKVNITCMSKYDFFLKASDVHIEIDMELLGCHSKNIWSEIYKCVIDIIQARKKKLFYIVCKNFEKIHLDLLEIFNFYMDYLQIERIHVKYILLTENVSFIPYKILQKCKIINVKQPSISIIHKASKKYKVSNLKSCFLLDTKRKLTDKLIDALLEKEIIQLRNAIYDILILQENMYDILYCVMNRLNISSVSHKMYEYMKYYNNNYRPIYHLELICLLLLDTYESTTCKEVISDSET